MAWLRRSTRTALLALACGALAREPSSDYLPQVFLESWPFLHKHDKIEILLTPRERMGYVLDFEKFDTDADGFVTLDEFTNYLIEGMSVKGLADVNTAPSPQKESSYFARRGRLGMGSKKGFASPRD